MTRALPPRYPIVCLRESWGALVAGRRPHRGVDEVLIGRRLSERAATKRDPGPIVTGRRNYEVSQIRVRRNNNALGIMGPHFLWQRSDPLHAICFTRRTD